MNNIKMTVPLDQLKDRVCKCGGFIFTSALALKELPPIYSPSGQYETTMQQVGFVCIRCGNVLPVRPEFPKTEDDVIEGKPETAGSNDSKIILVKG